MRISPEYLGTGLLVIWNENDTSWPADICLSEQMYIVNSPVIWFHLAIPAPFSRPPVLATFAWAQNRLEPVMSTTELENPSKPLMRKEGGSVDDEYAVRGSDPLRPTVDFRLTVIVFGEEV